MTLAKTKCKSSPSVFDGEATGRPEAVPREGLPRGKVCPGVEEDER